MRPFLRFMIGRAVCDSSRVRAPSTRTREVGVQAHAVAVDHDADGRRLLLLAAAGDEEPPGPGGHMLVRASKSVVILEEAVRDVDGGEVKVVGQAVLVHAVLVPDGRRWKAMEGDERCEKAMEGMR